MNVGVYYSYIFIKTYLYDKCMYLVYDLSYNFCLFTANSCSLSFRIMLQCSVPCINKAVSNVKGLVNNLATLF